MNGICIFYYNIDEKKPNGIEKKILSQIRLFDEEGLTCKLVVFPYEFSFITKILGRLPFTNTDPVWKYDCRFDNIDFLYFRRPLNMTGAMRRFLGKVKQKSPNVKIIIEFPTYPYDDEIRSSKLNIPLYIKDKYNRKRLRGLVDRFAIIGNSDKTKKLWGIPVIWFANGVNIKTIRCKKDLHRKGEIHIVCVATFEYWHGYDRVLEGLGKYYQEKKPWKIYLHMVGEGGQKDNYQELVKKYSIENYIIFEGECMGERLEKIYDMADIALECFGMYRKNMEISSSLKSREYLAKGLPIVAGCKVDIFQNNAFPYYLEFPNDSSIIDVEKIVDFYELCYPNEQSHETVIKEIRNFAEEKIDMKMTMKDIIDYIKNT